MQTKNVVSIVQKGNKVKFILVNKSDFAKEYVEIQNKLLKKNENKWEENTLTDINVVGELRNDGDNKVSVILENGRPIMVYLDDIHILPQAYPIYLSYYYIYHNINYLNLHLCQQHNNIEQSIHHLINIYIRLF